jgi:hypothetical protein
LGTFFRGKVSALILPKMGFATFWAFFPQTNLVALNLTCVPIEILRQRQAHCLLVSFRVTRLSEFLPFGRLFTVSIKKYISSRYL